MVSPALLKKCVLHTSSNHVFEESSQPESYGASNSLNVSLPVTQISSISNHPPMFVMSGVKPQVSADVHSLEVLEVQWFVLLTQVKPRSSVLSQSHIGKRR